MDWRKPLLGVGVAAVSGLLLGGAMKPDLGAGDRPEGPQIFSGWSGARSTGPFDDGMTLAYHQGELPDYVIGTDWAQATAYVERPQVIRHDPEADFGAYDPPAFEPVDYAAPRYEPPPAEAPAYPSMAGGARYDQPRATAPEPPPPPVFDDEVMPEATGDTSVTGQG